MFVSATAAITASVTFTFMFTLFLSPVLYGVEGEGEEAAGRSVYMYVRACVSEENMACLTVSPFFFDDQILKMFENQNFTRDGIKNFF